MKKNLFILLTVTLLFASRNSLSQTNAYFQNNPVWQVASACVLSPNEQCVRQEYHNYYIKGDTTINALVYKKVFKKGQGSYSPKTPGSQVNCPGPYHYTDSLASYFLRSAGKKVFVRKSGEATESLFYDYDLHVGDTLPVTYNNSETDLTITSIDSISTSSGYRKRFYLSSNTHTEYLLEGIGHWGGLFEPIGPIFDCGFKLECFSINGTAYYPASGPTCDIAVGIASHKTIKALSVYPNPFITETIMQFDAPVFKAQLIIYDLNGNCVRRLQGITGENIKIDRGSLNSGLYFYELIQTEKSSATGKLLIAD